MIAPGGYTTARSSRRWRQPGPPWWNSPGWTRQCANEWYTYVTDTVSVYHPRQKRSLRKRRRGWA